MRGANGAGRAEFVAGAARQAVAVVASEELVFFEPLAAEFTRRGALPPERRYSDGIIESGWDTVAVLVTPVALTLANSLYNRLADNVSDEILKRGGHQLGRVWRRLRRSAPAVEQPDEQAVPLEAGSAEGGEAELREQLISQALELGVSQDKAPLLVDSLLAAACPGGPPPKAPPTESTSGAT